MNNPCAEIYLPKSHDQFMYEFLIKLGLIKPTIFSKLGDLL